MHDGKAKSSRSKTYIGRWDNGLIRGVAIEEITKERHERHCRLSNISWQENQSRIIFWTDLVKLSDPGIVRLYMRQLFDDHLIDKKSWNLILSLASEQQKHHQHLNPQIL